MAKPVGRGGEDDGVLEVEPEGDVDGEGEVIGDDVECDM
jgi:hypothetical protein